MIKQLYFEVTFSLTSPSQILTSLIKLWNLIFDSLKKRKILVDLRGNHVKYKGLRTEEKEART